MRALPITRTSEGDIVRICEHGRLLSDPSARVGTTECLVLIVCPVRGALVCEHSPLWHPRHCETFWARSWVWVRSTGPLTQVRTMPRTDRHP